MAWFFVSGSFLTSVLYVLAMTGRVKEDSEEALVMVLEGIRYVRGWKL